MKEPARAAAIAVASERSCNQLGVGAFMPHGDLVFPARKNLQETTVDLLGCVGVGWMCGAKSAAHDIRASTTPSSLRMWSSLGDIFNLFYVGWRRINPRGRHIATLTADDSKKQGFRPITVSGYADTSGSSAYNQKLSLKRARIVAKLLIAEGIPAKWITVQAYGDTRLLIPTGSGVRQEQNRRVEIIRATADPNDPNS